MKIRGKNQQNGEWKIIVVGFEWRGFLLRFYYFFLGVSGEWLFIGFVCGKNSVKKKFTTSIKGFEPRIERFSLNFTVLNGK
jgi:hypothetical protein